MISIENRKMVIPALEKRLGYEGDNAVSTRVFRLTDMTLAQFTFKLDTQKNDNSTGIVALSKAVNRGFATSRIPYRGDYVSQYSVDYSSSSGQKYLTILTDNASSQSAAYGEYTVYHDSDGTKQVTISFSANCSYSSGIGSASASVSIVLPTIARSTVPSVSNITLGSAATISLSPASSALRHTLRAQFGSRSQTTIVSQTASTSISWAPSLDEAYSAPNASNAAGVLYCDTYSNGTLVGTQAVSISAAIPSSIIPSGSVSHSEAVAVRPRLSVIVTVIVLLPAVASSAVVKDEPCLFIHI